MGNMMRISGMATGMDTDTTVKQLMKPFAMKVDKMKQDKQIMQWKQEMMRDMIKELRDLKSSYLNIDSTDATNMIKSSSFSVANITSSNESVLIATAMPGATNVPSNVKVNQVATGAKIPVDLKSILAAGKELSLSTKMEDLGFVNPTETIELKFKENGGAEQSFTVEVKKDDTLQTFINNLNSAKSNGTGSALYEKVQISFSELTKSLNFETRNAGDGQWLKLDSAKLPPVATYTNESTGKKAIVEIDGVEVKKDTNNFTIDNVCYSLNAKYVVAPATQNVTLTSKADAQKSVDKIKGFIDKYNAIVDKVYKKYSEAKQYKFTPLTDEQKKDMKDDDIKNWETKAKEGLIKGDEGIGSMLNAMRSAVFGPVAGAGISLNEIGLDSYSGFEATLKPGQIKVVDASKLKTALETRGDQVMKLFAATPDGTITKPEDINANTGVFKRLSDVLNNYVVKFDGILLKKAGIEGTLSATKNDLTDKMKEKDVIIAQMEKKMATQEERYYQKFAALEKAMNNLNSQSSWLTAQLGGGK